MNKKKLLIATTTAIAICALVLLGCMACVRSTPVTQKVAAMMDVEAQRTLAAGANEIEVNYEAIESAGTQPTGGVVRTAAEFSYMMHDTESSTTYTLANDFYVSALMWKHLSSYTMQRSIVIKGGYDDVVMENGEEKVVHKRHRIVYAPNLDADIIEVSTSVYGGLFAQFSGKLEEVEYMFRGRLEGNAQDNVAIYYGGLAGKLNGAKITDSVITMNGALVCYANRTGATLYVGGIAGQMDGAEFSNSTITMSGTVNVSSLYEETEGTISSSRNNVLYAGGLAAVSFNDTKFTDKCAIKVGGSILTSDNAAKNDGDDDCNGDAYVLPAGGLFAVGGKVTISGCDVTVGARINATGSTNSAVNGAIAGGLFGIAGTYAKSDGTDAKSDLRVSNSVITLSANISAVTSRVHKNKIFSSDIVGGSAYHGGIVGRFNDVSLDSNSKFVNNAILYNATIKESAKYCPTDGKSYYGYLSGNNPNTFNAWNKGNIWTVLSGSEEVTTIEVRQSTNNEGGASNDCGEIGVLMVYGGGTIKAEVNDSSQLQFVAKQQYSPFKGWYSDLAVPTLYKDSQSMGYQSGEVVTESDTDIEGNPYTRYILRPTRGGKTLYAVFLTEQISDAGSFVQWTEEMNSGLNRSWVVANVVADITITKGVYIVKDFYGRFYGNDHTITFQNKVEMTGTANMTAEEQSTYFSGSTDATVAGVAGIIRILHTGAEVRHLNITFAGSMYGGANGSTPVDDYVAVGVLAGINNGIISDIVLDIPQAGNVVATAGANAYGGGLVGIDNGTITNVQASIQGNYSVKGQNAVVGGLVGRANSTGNKQYTNINIDIKGQLEGFVLAGGSKSTVGGLVGECRNGEGLTGMELSNVIVNVHDKSNMGGDALVTNCSHNIDNYADLLSTIDEFVVTDPSASTKLADIEEVLEELGVGTRSVEDLATLKTNVATAKSRLTAGTLTQKWFEQNVKDIAVTLDCNAPCVTCKENAVRAYFGNVSGQRVTDTWAIGSYTQYPGDGTFGAGVSAITYFGTTLDLEAAQNTGLNMVFVRNGTAQGSLSPLSFTVPDTDSAHVFTGWYTDYNHTVMVDDNLLSGNAFAPGTQSGSVWYSSVINSMITTAAELDVLSNTTNAGQAYHDVTFTLGCDVVASGNFTPIGNVNHAFAGTFDGKGYSVTFQGFNMVMSNIGMFGCVGVGGTVKQVVVKIKSVSNLGGRVFGAVVAVNRGSVGQNSQNERVRAEIYGTVSGASVAGGVVGTNDVGGLVYNVETLFVGDIIAGTTYQGRLVADYNGAMSAAGGTVGHNLGTVRNAKVTCGVASIDEYLNSVYASATTGNAYAGGLVGYNVGQLYSGAVEVFYDNDSVCVANVPNRAGSYAAILVGYNNSNEVDALWAVYQLETEGFLTPYTNPLLNGTKADIGNRMVRYGYGNLSTEIYANTDTQDKGGNILFAASADATEKIPFYSYTHSLEYGEPVTDAAGSNYSPAIGVGDTAGINGVTYYAVFADAEINTENEFYKFAALVNSGFRAYVSYIVHLNSGTALSLNAADLQSVGKDGNVFVGTFDGSGKDIEIKSNAADYDIVPLFGTIGATSTVCNFTLSVDPSLRYRGGFDYEGVSVVGGMAHVNLGTVNNVIIKFQSGIYGSGNYADGYATYAGAVVGYNAGSIMGTNVSLNASTVGGKAMAARVFGLWAGGVAGYNAPSGWIGSNAISSVVLSLGADVETPPTVPASIVGIKGAGTLVGLNEGTIANAAATVYGLVGSPVVQDGKFVMGATLGSDTDDYTVPAVSEICRVGGIAGINRGTVYGTRATIASAATMRATNGYLGGIAGESQAGTLGQNGVEDSIKVYWQRAITGYLPAYFGGIAGRNAANIYGVSIDVRADVCGVDYVGVAVGYNTGFARGITATVQKNATVYATAADSYVGGVVGYNTANLDQCAVTVNGVLGRADTHTVGGFAGYTAGVFSNSYVILTNNIVAKSVKGLAAGATAMEEDEDGPKEYGVNAWAVAFNSERTLASESGDSGFNVLKIVASEMVTPSLVKLTSHTYVRFTSNIASGLAWYSDISVLQKATVSNNVFTPAEGLRNCIYHLCAYDLEVDNVTDLVNLYTFVNSADLFNGVMFKLINDIEVTNGINIQPIGSSAYPFTGIFEGDGHTITFHAGSVIVGSEYSGLFGRIAEGAVVRNFIVQVDEDVLIGSTTDYVGALAGRVDGKVSNVGVNLVSAPRSSKETALVGALAGEIGASATFENVWVIIYNSEVDNAAAVDYSQGDYNVIDVYGSGIMRIARRETDWVNNGVMQFDISVVTGISFFDNWYSAFASATEFSPAAGLGEYRISYDGDNVASTFYRPLTTLTGRRFTASFVKMVITNEQDFYNFAANINMYGVKDGQFRFSLGRGVTRLTVDLSKMQPIGTATHPFQATLDGSVTSYGNPDTYAYTLVLKGAVQDADYSGLFGYIGEGAVIRNLVVRADNVEPQSIGYRESIYTGFFAAYIQGSAARPVTIESVVVGVGTNTTLVNSHADAIGGIAGLWGNNVNVRNSWVVLPENGNYNAMGSMRTPVGILPYTEGLGETYHIDLPNTMYLCGDGLINYKHMQSDAGEYVCKIRFELTSTDKYPLGFIEKSNLDMENAVLSTEMITTIDDAKAGMVYLALYIKTTVENEQDLKNIANMVNVQNRSYLGVTFTLLNDITLSAAEWTPIGGAVETTVGSGEYKQVAFISAFDGQGHTITMPEGMTCDAQYAGLFGILSASARIRNLSIKCAARVGSATASQYAGVLAGIDQGASLQNIIVDVQQVTTLSANMATSRVAVNRALNYDVNGKVTNYADVSKAVNVWVLNRNSRYSDEQNEAEQAFYDNVDGTWQGTYNGGVNVVTVIANGTVDLSFHTTGGSIDGIVLRNAAAVAKPIKMWYTAPNGVVTGYEPLWDGSAYRNEYTVTYSAADASLRGLILYASFLNENIATITDLIDLAQDVAAGCDLYGLTFYLENDVVIDAATVGAGFRPIGTETTPFTATFNGLGHDGKVHTISLAADALIEGRTAGIFGVVGTYGTIRNLKLDLRGTIGYAGYTDAQVQEGKVNTLYAGAIAVSYGTLHSVLIDAGSLTVNALQYGVAAASVAYDYSNYYTNTWLIVNADNDIAFFGRVDGGTDSTINVMRVVGMGRLQATFDVYGDECYVRFSNDTTYKQSIDGVNFTFAIKGWYSNFSADNQLSQALNVTALDTGITAGDNGTYLASSGIFSSRFEVVIMSTVIVSEQDMIAIARDVNVGGYTFENTTFTLGHDIVISSMDFAPIGSAGTPFLGTFQGMYNGTYYTVTMNRHAVDPETGLPTDAGVALFGDNRGVIENLIVLLQVDVPTYSSTVGVVAQYNSGTIRNALVRVWRVVNTRETAVTVYGNVVGGVVGYNSGTVQNCVVFVGTTAVLQATYTVGGLVGQNEGMLMGSTYDQFEAWRDNATAYDALQPWYNSLDGETRQSVTLSSVLLLGTVRVDNNISTETLFAGGAVGESRNRATINRVTVRIAEDGRVLGNGRKLEIGGLAGRSLATLSNSVVMDSGRVYTDSVPDTAYIGHFIGNLQGSAPNCWLVVAVPPTVQAMGNGSSVNLLQINGNGSIDTYLDASNNIIFRDITPSSGAALDGWYVNSGIQVPDDVGGVDTVSFRPNRNITAYTVNVVFINTQINSPEDLLAMANTVNAGLFSTGLTFSLSADLTIDMKDSALFRQVTIGTREGEGNAFKHVFDGQGHTITIVNSTNGAYGSTYMGLFGYTGQDAIIRDLNLVLTGGIYGTVGTTQMLGALVAENNGLVQNCHVYLGCAPAGTGVSPSGITLRMVGVKLGGIAAENFGTITQSTLTSYASLHAEAGSDNASNQYVGGVVGNNRGVINNINVALYAPSGYAALSASAGNGTSYVGGVAGNNAIDVSAVYVQLVGVAIESHSSVQAYAGGICGSNTGSVHHAYIDWRGAGLVADHSAGGIVGTNNNNLASILIDYAVGSVLSAGADSAVCNTGNYGLADNVWVFNRDVALNSRNAHVNSVTVGTAAVTHNDPATVIEEGRVYFDASINAEEGLTVYADADTDYRSVRLDDFVSYNGGYLRLTSYSNMRGVRVRAEIRRTVAHQTELKAMARALSEAGQAITKTYTLTDDIVIDGRYDAIGTSANPFRAILAGNMHNITFAEDVVFVGNKSLFGTIATDGSVNGVIIRYNVDMYDENAAGVAITNNGKLKDIVLYTAEGVRLYHPTYKSGEGSVNGEAWVVTRVGISASVANADNRYGVILVSGNGDLDVSLVGGTLVFTARASEGSTFAGYSDGNKMVSNVGSAGNKNLFNVSTAVANNNSNMSYTAEFLSSQLGSEADLNVLLLLLSKGYVTATDDVFSMTDDIAVSGNTLKHIGSFKGTLDGNFHTLKVVGNVDGAFALTGAIFTNLVIDSTDLVGESYLFDAGATASLQRVAVLRSGQYGQLQRNNARNLKQLSYVFVVSPDAACVTDSKVISDTNTVDVGLIVRGDYDIGFDAAGAAMRAVAADGDNTYFVGWYSLSGAFVESNNAAVLSQQGKYTVRYLSATLGTKADLLALSAAVNVGYAFTENAFTLTADIDYADGEAIGTAEHAFAGIIEGNGHVITAGTLFRHFEGTLSDLIVRTASGDGFAAGLGGRLHRVVVRSTAATARFATDVACLIDDCWLVTENTVAADNSTYVKVLQQGDNVALTVSLTEGVVFTATPASTEYFLLWRDAEGNVISNEDYNTLSHATGRFYRVSGESGVTNAAEFAYLAVATAHGYSSEIKLNNDITIDSAIRPLTNVFKLDGDGHTLYIASPITLAALTADSGINSHIYNIVLDIAENVSAFELCRGAEGADVDLANIVIKSQATTAVTSVGDYSNVWIMQRGALRDMTAFIADYAGLADKLNVLLYDKGDLAIEFVRVGYDIDSMTVKVSDNDALHFLGYLDTVNHTDATYTLNGTNQRVQAVFANKVLTNTAGWTHAAKAMALTDNRNFRFTLGADIVADAGFVPFEGFAGTLDGDFFSILVTPEATLLDTEDAAGVVGLAAGANVTNLAVEIARGTNVGTHTWFVRPAGATVGNSWLVNYTNTDVAHADGVRMMTIVDQGEGAGQIRVDKRTVSGAADFAFVAQNTAVYSLRYYQMGGTDYDVDNANTVSAVFTNGTADVRALFYYCYTVYVQPEGIPEELVSATYLSQSTPYWLGFSYDDPKVEFKRVVQGYMFAGFEYPAAAAPAIDEAGSTFTRLSINVAALSTTGSITVTAKFVLIESDWSELTYGDMTLAEIDAYLTPGADIMQLFEADDKYAYERFDSPDSNVLSDTVTPYHAGGYVIRFNITHDGVLVGRSDGLSFHITPRELYFESLHVSVKKYDGNETAKIDSAELGGFAQSDIDKGARRQYDPKLGIQLEYFDPATGEATPNAGTWNLRVREGSYIATTVFNNTILFNDDYVLPQGALYIYAESDGNFVRTDNVYQAIISKQDLVLVVSDQSIDYLAQFGSRDANGVLVPFNIYDYLSFQWSGTVYGADNDTLSDNSQKARLLRIAGDRTTIRDNKVEYAYTIRMPGSYAIEVIKDVLVNYEPKISENKATFTVKPSAVSVNLQDISLQYGDTLTSLNYTLSAADAHAVTSFTAEELQTVSGIYTNLTAANVDGWFAVTLVPEYAIVDDANVAFNLAPIRVNAEGNAVKAGVQYRFTAANKAFTLADGNATMVINDSNQKEYILRAQGVLTVTKRQIIYNITTDTHKVFGAEDGTIGGRTVGKPLMNGDKLRFSRLEGELVGSYAITASVVTQDGQDVTANYDLLPYNDAQFVYTIVKRTVIVTRTGTGVFGYGSANLMDMPFVTDVSDRAKTKMLGALGISLRFDAAFVVKVGYFDSSTQPVGKYNNATLQVSYGRNVNASAAVENIEFSLDDKSKSYEIIRASLTVAAVDVTRGYDMTDNMSGANVRVTGWANGDENRLGVRVGRYVCEGISSAAGTYFYEPTELTLYSKSGSADLMDNYVIGTVTGAKYTISRIVVGVQALGGYYDEDGAFTEAPRSIITFGDKLAKWNFSLTTDLPDFMQEKYDAAELTTDLEISNWLEQNLSIVARTIASLPAGTTVAPETGAGYYSPYSADSNITLTVDATFNIASVAIILTDVRFYTESAKTAPTVSFKVKVYDRFMVDDDGEVIITGDELDDYFTVTSVENVADGQRVELSDSYAISFNFSAYDIEKCTYSLSSYVADGEDWIVYRESGSEPILYVAGTDEDGEEVYTAYNQDITESVNVKEGFFASMLNAMSEHPVYVAVGAAALAAFIAASVLAAVLYRRRRLRAKVQRELRNQGIVDRLNQSNGDQE